MRKVLSSALVACLILLGTSARADDAAKAILEKAIKAHGGAEKLAKERILQTKAKGALELFGGVNFTQETVSAAGKFKETMELSVNGQNLTVVTAFDGKEGWITINGQNAPVQDQVLDELKEAGYARRLGKFDFLNDKAFELSSLGETKLDGKTLVGVKVAHKDHKDVRLFFDKETGLLSRIERKGFDGMTNQEVDEERIIKEYQEADGTKVPKKVLINRDGKKFVEVEVEEVKVLDKVDDNTFTKP